MCWLQLNGPLWTNLHQAQECVADVSNRTYVSKNNDTICLIHDTLSVFIDWNKWRLKVNLPSLSGVSHQQ